MNRLSLALTVPLAVAGVPVAASDVSYSLTNASSLIIVEFYASPADEGNWGEDLLAAGVLPPGETGTLTIAGGSEQCSTDLRFVMEDGQEFVETVDICGTPSFTLEN
ncbi:hypothetical protein Rumeso_04365 [Rubellimicrobium mesophilum DSM 19309]|uniref:Uncharacterized protein n=1 Tax=Rubellimicrobium mesophilum DSM 19309 TaxID=442562 RepID=A0A017HIB0_9RHOB|nr:hypothetical protein [Rubellimicrobium mesophilum]EYD74071.1 hypothetical protein Rumeso_04365 [Rubellimicrobium mesophilum DSM 19309]